jgi:hypothetical protein
MSAYFVPDDHINALIECAYRWSNSAFSIWMGANKPTLYLNQEEDCQIIARLLRYANVKSLAARYPKDFWVMYPNYDPILDNRDIPEISYRPFNRLPNPVQALKWLDNYEYQTCEFEGWVYSDAKKICDAFRSRYNYALPGYGTAEWGFTKTTLLFQSIWPIGR